MAEARIRRPAVAGAFYPDNPQVLRKMIQEFLNTAELPPEINMASGAIRAIIAPHAGYIYSGPTAGYAFKALMGLPRRRWTVFLMGPAHRVPFYGVALGDYTIWRTPLGDAVVARERAEEMLARSSLYIRLSQAHDPEHCLEVELPFLQMVLPEFEFVPMLFGDVDPRAVASDLASHLGTNDLVVVSSDLSHYLSYDRARQLDTAFLDAILAGDQTSVSRGEACGRAPILTCMEIARQCGWRPVLLDYRSSGDTAGDRWQVVGYGAIAYLAS